jgi:hypothetical protein
MTKNSESDYFFFLPQNQNIFFGKKTIILHPPSPLPFKLNGRSLTRKKNENLPCLIKGRKK